MVGAVHAGFNETYVIGKATSCSFFVIPKYVMSAMISSAPLITLDRWHMYDIKPWHWREMA